jgi:hypothetical protein
MAGQNSSIFGGFDAHHEGHRPGRSTDSTAVSKFGLTIGSRRMRQPPVHRAFARHLAPVRKAEWVVYAKPPFAGPEQVLDYVGRYTHRVAISNNRLLAIQAGQIRFRWKDYRDQGQTKSMTLSAEEFIRRFLLHALPDGFHRIRYYGFLGNRHCQEKLAQCRELLGMAPPVEAPPPEDYRDRHEQLTGSSLRDCPVCHRGYMVMVEMLTPQRLPAIRDTS